MYKSFFFLFLSFLFFFFVHVGVRLGSARSRVLCKGKGKKKKGVRKKENVCEMRRFFFVFFVPSFEERGGVGQLKRILPSRERGHGTF